MSIKAPKEIARDERLQCSDSVRREMHYLIQGLIDMLPAHAVARKGSAAVCADGGCVGTSGQGFLIASCILTMHLSGPAIQPNPHQHMGSCLPEIEVLPFSTTMPFSSSTFSTLTFCVVTCCPPILPGMRFPGRTLDPPPCD